MPIKIPSSLPARAILESENIAVITEERAVTQDIRPLKILILNLMPTKIATETQILRLIGNSPLQIEIEFLKTATYQPKNTPKSHLNSFYKTFNEIKHNHYDGLIVTGAPVELMEFEMVAYWDELCTIMNWTKKMVFSTFYICWGAQAALYHEYSVQKTAMDRKLFGIFSHRLKAPNHPLMRGFDDVFYAPHSRHTTIKRDDILKNPELEILADSDIAGEYIIGKKNHRAFYITGHSEYDADTLAGEYFRDLKQGLSIQLPKNYFPGNNYNNKPILTWRAHSTLLFSNWINLIYQETPYDIIEIEKLQQA